MRHLAPIVAALVLAGCAGGSGSVPPTTPTPVTQAAPQAEPPQPPAPVQADGALASPPSGALAPATAPDGLAVMPAEAPSRTNPPPRPGCEKGGPERRLPEPAGPVSPVQARVFVRDDPGISAPIMALVAGLPVTIVVQFDQPVDQGSFALAVTDNRCDYEPGPIDQDTRWRTDREAEITVRELPAGKPGPYGVSFGGGKDRQGQEVRELRFGFAVEPGRRVQVLAVPVAGGNPKLMFDRDLHLEMRSISPDGRYLLLARQIWAHANSHSAVRIPYVANLVTGSLRAYSRGEVLGWRWDLTGRAVWINGWQRLSLDDGEDTGQTLLGRLPAGDGHLLGARVSPDGRWLAAVHTARPNDRTGQADLVLVDLDSDQAQTVPAAVGYLEPPNGPARVELQWLPDSSQLLVASYRRGAHPEQGTPEPLQVDPRTLERKALPAAAGATGWVSFSPGGNYQVISGYGVVTRDGKVLPDPTLASGLWAPDDRFVLLGGGADFTVLELSTGKRTPLRLPPEPESEPVPGPEPGPGPGYLHPLGFSADGTEVYFVRR